MRTPQKRPASCGGIRLQFLSQLTFSFFGLWMLTVLASSAAAKEAATDSIDYVKGSWKHITEEKRRVPRQSETPPEGAHYEAAAASPKSSNHQPRPYRRLVSSSKTDPAKMPVSGGVVEEAASKGQSQAKAAPTIAGGAVGGEVAQAPLFDMSKPLTQEQKEGINRATDVANSILERLGLSMGGAGGIGAGGQQREYRRRPADAFQSDAELNAIVNEAQQNRVDLQELTSGHIPGLAPIPVPGFAGPQDIPTLPGVNTIPGLSNFNYIVGQLVPQMIPPTNTLLGSSISRLLPKETTKNLAKNVFRAVHPAAENVEMARMMGRWFQVINSPHVIREACTVTHFGALTNNTYSATFTILKFYREGNPNGPPRFSLGYGFKAGDTGQFILHSSNSPDSEPFWVIKLGPLNEYNQYDYAIVSNWVRFPVFVIARDPERFRRVHMKGVLQFLEDNNYINVVTKAFNMISPVDYSQCQYTPTFSGAGKR